MRHEFTAVYEADGDWIVAYCPEVGSAGFPPTLNEK